MRRLGRVVIGDVGHLRVVMLSWEYPPRIVGGISRHVDGLSKALVKMGVGIHIITNDFPGASSEEIVDEVRVHRVPIEIAAPNFHTWVMLMNHFFAKRLAQLAREYQFDVVHAHDWLTTTSAVEAKHYLETPFVATLHSLEFKRSGGIYSVESRMIENVEWWSTYEAGIVIVCSGSMKRDVVERFATPEAKVWVLPNGINPVEFQGALDKGSVRSRYGVFGDDRLVLFVGRLTPQKGCEYLIRALQRLPHNIKLIIVGDGWMRGSLESEAYTTGQSWRVRFTGFLPDREVISLMKVADVLVVPSVYEPFGVVALEGMAAGAPVVASNVDGLAEVVHHEHNGIIVHPRDPDSIAWGVQRVLSDPGNSTRLVQNAAKDIKERYSWDAVASLTVAAYKRALAEKEA